MCRYFHYKDVNMAYSGDGATAGKNTLEYGVSLEDMYQFRDNGFTKEKTETKYTEDKEPYECKVRYSFKGWQMKLNSFAEKDQYPAIEIYKASGKSGRHFRPHHGGHQHLPDGRTHPCLTGASREWQVHAGKLGRKHAGGSPREDPCKGIH